MEQLLELADVKAPAPHKSNQVLRWAPWCVVGVLLLALYGQVMASLASDWWNDPNASHGLLVPPLTAYIAWKRRRHTLAVPAVPDLMGLFWIAAGCILLL